MPRESVYTKYKITLSSFLLISLFFTCSSLWAQTTGVSGPTSADDFLTRIATQIPMLMRMVTAIAYVLGIYFVIAGIMKLKEYGESRTMMSQQHNLRGPLIFIIVGAFLLYLPTTVNVGLSTFWTDPNPYAYVTQQTAWSDFWNTCFLIVQFVGTIAFIRGLVILSHLGGHGGQPGTFSRGVTHIIGGIFCINIYQFVQVIFTTLGINT